MVMKKKNKRMEIMEITILNKNLMNKLQWLLLLLFQVIQMSKQYQMNLILYPYVRFDCFIYLTIILIFRIVARPMAERTPNPVIEVIPEDILQVKIADLGNACWTVSLMIIQTMKFLCDYF
jgi:hypothetical protein